MKNQEIAQGAGTTIKEQISQYPKKLKDLKLIFHFKYPKLFLLLLAIAISYLIFSNPGVSRYISGLDQLKYLGIFIAGFLIAFGFTAPISAGFFIAANPSNILLAAMIGGLGAMLSDLLIFKLIKVSFIDEFKLLEKTKFMKKVSQIMDYSLGKRIKTYLLYVFAGIAIASPLPDELGVMLLAGLTKIRLNIFLALGFILNTIGILILLYI